MKKTRLGISATISLLIVVVIIGAAFFVAIPMVGPQPTTTTFSTSTSSSSSSTSPTSSTSAPSTGTLTFSIANSEPLIVGPGTNETVTVGFTTIGTVTGSYALNASGLPHGVAATFSPSSVSFPSSATISLTFSAASGAPVVNATINLQATSSSKVYKQPFTLMSVGGLVLIQGNAFVPNSLTVAAGTKVYWLNLDSGVSEAGGFAGGHDVNAVDGSFSSGATGGLAQYDIYGHTFTTAGTVSYECKAQSFTGQVVVTG